MPKGQSSCKKSIKSYDRHVPAHEAGFKRCAVNWGNFGHPGVTLDSELDKQFEVTRGMKSKLLLGYARGLHQTLAADAKKDEKFRLYVAFDRE